MAYIPPHRRHSKDAEKPSPVPASISLPQTKPRHYSPKSYAGKKNDNRGSQIRKILYSESAISQWIAVGSRVDEPLHNVHLEPASFEVIERRIGQKPLVLVKSDIDNGRNKNEEDISTAPWGFVLDNLRRDLLGSFQSLMGEKGTNCQSKASIVFRIGKILFHGSSSTWECFDKSNVTQSSVRQLKRIFHTNISDSYMNRVSSHIAPVTGMDFYKEKKSYLVKFSDTMRTEGTIACKCRVSDDGKKLYLHKIEVNQLRHFVVDFSCVEKVMDLRLMLWTKVILKSLEDEEMDMIRQVLTSAIIDPNVKGGLRWRLGDDTAGDRYRVVDIWQMVCKKYKNQASRLKAREVDRFDFTTSTGEFSREVIVKMPGLLSLLQEEEDISDMLSSSLRMMWDHFLSN